MLSRNEVLRLMAGGLALGAGLSAGGCVRAPQGLCIGFVVKQPEVQWFQDEWRYAEMAAQKYGFELLKIGATDGDRVLVAIDNLGAKGASGFIICAPDPRLGTAIKQAALVNELKVMSVDDRLIGANGQPISSVPHVGISALNVGREAGRTLHDELKRRNWVWSDVGLLYLSYDSLQTAKERSGGARDYLLEQGLPADHVFAAPQKTTDTEGGFNAAAPVLNRRLRFKKWVIVGMNDETVLGGVRACEGSGLDASDVIGVGIGGSGTALAEFAKTRTTGFFATILLSPRAHGYDTAEAMYLWVTRNIVPKPLTLTSGYQMRRDNFKQIMAEQGQ